MSHTASVGLIIFLAIALARVARSYVARSADRPVTGEAIHFPKLYPILAILAASFFLFGSLNGLIRDGQSHWLLFLLPAVGVIVLFLPLLFRSEVSLSDNSLRGPSSLFGPFIGFSRTSIELTDIDRVGGTKNGYVFYEASDGRRIYVNPACAGSAHFNAMVTSRRAGGS